MKAPDGLSYSKEHEWMRVDGDEGVIGITDHAQAELGDVVFVELPGVGDEFARGDSFGSLESVKAVSEIYLPVDGTIAAVNEALEDTPETINEDPYGDGWIIKISISDPSQLEDMMSEEEYHLYVKNEAGD